MTISFAHCLVLGAVLLGCGALLAAWRKERGFAVSSLPLLAAGAAVCLAGAGRFAGREDPEIGQELAVLVCLASVAATVLGASWAGREVER